MEVLPSAKAEISESFPEEHSVLLRLYIYKLNLKNRLPANRLAKKSSVWNDTFGYAKGTLRGCLRSFHAGASRLSIMRMAAMSIMISEVWTMYS
jgi:hypothetical protein